MADLDDIKDGKDFGVGIEARNEAFSSRDRGPWIGACRTAWRASSIPRPGAP